MSEMPKESTGTVTTADSVNLGTPANSNNDPPLNWAEEKSLSDKPLVIEGEKKDD